MSRLAKIQTQTNRRQYRTRSQFSGTEQRPRLSVHVSLRNISAQIIDDTSGKTLAYASTLSGKNDGNMSQKASWIGEQIAKQATKAKVKKVVFDRGSRKYHGRIKSLAEAARAGGMEF